MDGGEGGGEDKDDTEGDDNNDIQKYWVFGLCPSSGFF
jgi:hypothetical protein